MAREVITLYTLFIDTHDKNVLIVLFKDGKIFNKIDLETKNKHSEVAMPTIDKILNESNIDVSDLSNHLNQNFLLNLPYDKHPYGIMAFHLHDIL